MCVTVSGMMCVLVNHWEEEAVNSGLVILSKSEQ